VLAYTYLLQKIKKGKAKMNEKNSSDTAEQLERISQKLADRADSTLDPNVAKANGVNWDAQKGTVSVEQPDGGYAKTEKVDSGEAMIAASLDPNQGGASVRVGESDKVMYSDKNGVASEIIRNPGDAEERAVAASALKDIKSGIDQEQARQQEAADTQQAA
jgi:hypothetical protein